MSIEDNSSGMSYSNFVDSLNLVDNPPIEGDVLKFIGGVWKPSAVNGDIIPQDITGLKAINITQTTLDLTWITSSGTRSYDIEKNGTFLVNTRSNHCSITELAAGTPYTFTVKAKNNAGSSSGASINVTTLQAIPQPVTNLRPIGVSDTSVTLAWTASSGATSYDIFKNGELLTNVQPASFAVTGLTGGTTYNFSVKAKNSAGTSSSAFIDVTTTKSTVTDQLVFHVDFSGKAGSVSNIVYDTVNNIACTLTGVAHDGTDGWLENRGLFLNANDYVTIPSNTGVIHNSIDFNKTGATFQYVAYNPVGVLFRTDPANLRSYINSDSTVTNTTIKYTAANGTDKFFAGGSTYYRSTDGSNRLLKDSLLGSEELNVIAVRIHPDGKLDMVVNGLPAVTVSKPPDFIKYVDMLATSPLYLRRDQVEINGKSSTVIRAFSIYSKVLSNEEALQNYKSFKDAEFLRKVSVYPSSVSIGPGESQSLAVFASPNYYSPYLSNKYESGNEGFVTVSSNGVLTGVNAGETNISVTSTYQGQQFVNHITVKVGSTNIPPPTSARTVTGISINRETKNLQVGESFAAMATTLPFDVTNDNIVIWESSNPDICTVNFGVLDAISAGTCTITAYDGTKTYSKSFTITVSVPVTMTEGQTYNVILTNHGISSGNTNSMSTTNGIQDALNYASSNGFKKIVFPQGVYLVTPDARTILLPTDMTIDFSNSIINIEPNLKTNSTGYTMFLMDYVSNTKLINAKIYGESDYTTVAASTERCLSIEIKEAYNSGLENCVISKSPGFNMATGVRLTKTGTNWTNISKDNFEAGSINANGVVDNTITTNTFRSKTYLDIASLGDYYLLGYTQGYFGYNYLRSRLYSIYFYDANKAFISAQMNNLQFYNYDKPVNAKFAKIVVYQEAAPTSQDTDFNAVAFLRTCGMPIKCFIRNCIFEDNFSCGLAMCGGQGWTLEGNHFARNGKRMPACDIDWEDGWDTMVGDIVRYNSFNSNLGVTVAAGCSLAFYGNTFDHSTLTMWGRSQNWRIYNNSFDGKGGQSNISLSTQAESYFSRNILKSIVYSKTINHTGASYKIRDTNNTLI